MMYLLFDIGGTNIRIATAEGDSIKDERTLETPLDFEEALRVIHETIPSLMGGQRVAAAALGIRGVLNGSKSILERDDILTNWVNQPLKDRLQEIIGAPLFLENDAAFNGLGEAVYGAGKESKIVGFITVSTGVGGARIVEGRIDKNSLGFEPGKQIIDLEGRTLEDLISGEALERRYNQKASEITDENIWNDAAKTLALGLNNISVLWSPEVLILGGSVMKSIPMEILEDQFKGILTAFPTPPKLKLADLGDSSGLYGALAYLHQKNS